MSNSNQQIRLSGSNYLLYILDQLSELEQLTFKKTFQGIRFYMNDLLFAVISGGKFRLKKVDAYPQPCGPISTIEPDFAADQYCEVPEEIIEDKSKLTESVKFVVTELGKEDAKS